MRINDGDRSERLWQPTDKIVDRIPANRVKITIMAFLSFLGSSTTNPYIISGVCTRSHIVLAHPSIVDSLVLSTSQAQAYDRVTQGLTKSSGRSVTGSIDLIGESYQKVKGSCNFVANSAMLALFEALYTTQSTSSTAITVDDKWVLNYYKTYFAFIDLTDEKWKTPIGLNWSHLLQFNLLEE